MKRKIRELVKNSFYCVLKLAILRRLIRSEWYGRAIGTLPANKRWPFLSTLDSEECVPVYVAGVSFSLITSSLDDHFVSAWLDGLSKWEVEPLAAWSSACRDARIVVDVGAYSGVYSIVAALSGAEKVFAYEPNPVSTLRIERNISTNSLSDQVDIRCIALSDKSGTAELIAPIGRPGSSGTQLTGLKIDREIGDWETICTTTTTCLDDDLPVDIHAKIDAIKIDAEGNEVKILQGAQNIVSSSRPVMIIECLSGVALAQVMEQLASHNYLCKPLDGVMPDPLSMRRSPSGTSTNFMLSPKS